MIPTTVIISGAAFLIGVALGVGKKAYDSQKRKNKSGKA